MDQSWKGRLKYHAVRLGKAIAVESSSMFCAILSPLNYFLSAELYNKDELQGFIKEWRQQEQISDVISYLLPSSDIVYGGQITTGFLKRRAIFLNLVLRHNSLTLASVVHNDDVNSS